MLIRRRSLLLGATGAMLARAADAAVCFDNTNDLVFRNDAPASGYPITLACWFNPDLVSSLTQVLMSLNASGDSSSLSLRVNVSQLQARTANTAGTANSATATAAPVNGVWQFACGVFASATSRVVYLNGANSGSDGANRPVGTLDRLGLGNDPESPGSSTDYLGKLAQMAVWATALASGDVSALAAGANPMSVQRSSLVAYYPLVSDYVSTLNGLVLSTSGTPTFCAPPSNPAVVPAFLRNGFVT